MEVAAADMISTLLRAAPSYQPESYNYLNLLGLILEPGQKFLTETVSWIDIYVFNFTLWDPLAD